MVKKITIATLWLQTRHEVTKVCFSYKQEFTCRHQLMKFDELILYVAVSDNLLGKPKKSHIENFNVTVSFSVNRWNKNP
jgi:hypothetical protein